MLNSELRRCLVACDVAGAMKAWVASGNYAEPLSPSEAMIALHIARCEMRTLPRKLKDYSRDWLAERGYQKIDGQWIHGPVLPLVAEAVGISVKSRDASFGRRIHVAMSDALHNARAKGITEAPIHKELMLKARDKVRFKAAITNRA